MQPPPSPTLFPHTTLFRSHLGVGGGWKQKGGRSGRHHERLHCCCTPYCTRGLHPSPAGPCQIGRHTSELQSQFHLVCRLLLEKKKWPAIPSRSIRLRRTRS